MKTAMQFAGLERVEPPSRPLHLAIGMFDGVHLGHRAVIDAAVSSAGGGGVSGVLTFWPHPSAVLRPANPTRMMQDSARRAAMLGALGVDMVITQDFTPGFSRLPAEDFMPWLRSRLPHLAAIYVGENFRFGQERRGDIGLLVESGRRLGVHVFSAPRVNFDGEPISSTRIRALLEAGEVEAANARLGYAYFSEGIVRGGKRLGRTLGFPTLNMEWVPGLRPRFGVYAMRVVRQAGGEALPAVANYGLRPTVENTVEPKVEAHVLGPCPLGEGDALRCEWLRFLRPEVRFAGVPALSEQIATDRREAAAFFGIPPAPTA